MANPGNSAKSLGKCGYPSVSTIVPPSTIIYSFIILFVLPRLLDYMPFDDTDFNWKELSVLSTENNWGKGQDARSLRMLWYKIREQIPKIESKSIRDCIRYAQGHVTGFTALAKVQKIKK